MSVLTNLPAMPNRLAIACHFLYSLGEQGETRDAVSKQLSPMKSQDDGEEQSGTTIAAAVLTELENFKLIETLHDERIALDKEIGAGANEKTDWKRYLEPLFRSRLTDPAKAIEYGQPDVPNALAWILIQDPFRPLTKGGTQVPLINRQLGAQDELRTVIGNDSRYQNLLYWARYVGVAEWISLKGADAIVPDPTRALTANFEKIFRTESELSIRQFVQRLGEVIPILEGGSVRTALEGRMVTKARDEGHLSRSTSLALKRLEERNIIRLPAQSDAETWVVDLPENPQRVSAVALVT